MMIKVNLCFVFFAVALSAFATKIPSQVATQNATGHVTSSIDKKSNPPLQVTANATLTAAPQQAKRTITKAGHQLHSLPKNASAAPSQRQLKIENFVDSHKGAIVSLLRKLLLPKLKARALQHYHGALPKKQQGAHYTEASNGNLDKEAMNYELGYFLGLQKAFKNRQMLVGDSGEENLVPLKLTHRPGSKAAVSDSGPLTGYTSVSLPFHKMTTPPVQENMQSLFSRYGIQDPSFLKKVTKADETDILKFAGKHNMDVFAERGNLKGIEDYVSKRAHISRPAETNEGGGQRIKKDDILGPSIFANMPDKQREDDEKPSAEVSSGPNPLEGLPTPLHRIVSQAHHISSGELHDLLQGTGGHVNWDEISGLIGEDEDKIKEKTEEMDKTPQVGSVFGEDTNVLTEKEFEGRPNGQDVEAADMQNAGQGEEGHEVEKRTFNNLLRLASRNDYEDNKNELKEVLKRIISRLSEIPGSREERFTPQYEVPSYRRGTVIRRPSSYYYRPVYTGYPSYPFEKLWRRNTIPRPTYSSKRASIPQQYTVSAVPFQAQRPSDDDYDYKSETPKPVTIETSGGVEAYALPKQTASPGAKIESYMAVPKDESYADAIAMLNRGSSIDDSLGDHLQGGFLQSFILPNSPQLYKRSPSRRFRSLLKYRMRLRRSDSDPKKMSTRRQKKAKTSHKNAADVSKAGKNSKGKSKARQFTKTNAQNSKAAAAEVTSKGSKKHEILRQGGMNYLSGLGSYVSPAVFESQSQNFFAQGGHDTSNLFHHLDGNTVMISGPQSGIGTAARKNFHSEHLDSASYHHKQLPRSRKMLEEIISNPRMSALRTDSFSGGAARSRLIGGRRISPAVDIYQDHSVSSSGDTPMMEVQSLRPNGDVEGKSRMNVMQNYDNDAQSGVETMGQGAVEMSSNYEVVKSPSGGAEMETGGMQSVNEDLVAQQNNRIMEEPKGDDNTGANAVSLEDVSGDTKQAISSTLAALDKQGIPGAKAELEGCCQIDPKAPCCEQSPDPRYSFNQNQPSFMSNAAAAQPSAGSRGYNAHPLSDQNLVQTMTKASQGLDEEVLAGGPNRHGLEDRVVNHVYLPDEDFDGIDWRKLHQPIHGLVGYEAHSKEDIQLLSDPFFSPGVGEPIGDHAKPSVVPQSLLGHPVNHLGQPSSSAASPQKVITTPMVTDAKNAPSAVLTADAVNTAKALTAAGAVQVIPTAGAGAGTAGAVAAGAGAAGAVTAGAVTAGAATAGTATAGNKEAQTAQIPSSTNSAAAIAATMAAAATAAGNNGGNNAAISHDQQLHAYLQNVHDLHKEIVTGAENAAANVGTVLANDVKNATHAHFIADVKDAALAKIKDNNAHAAELHQLANAVTSGNSKVAAKANNLVNNAVVMATQNLEVPVTKKAANATSGLTGHVYNSEELIHSLQQPRVNAIDALEAEANKLEDLHHNSLHMGTYFNQAALHSMNPVSVGKILSHGHVDANMHVPVVYGDWHAPAQDAEQGHDSYASHWNHVQLDSHPQVVDLTPMTPGGIQFTNPASVDMQGLTGVGLPTNAGEAITNAAANAAANGAAAANAANAAGAAAGGSNSIAANAAAAAASVNAAAAAGSGAAGAGTGAASGSNAVAGSVAAAAAGAAAGTGASPAGSGAAGAGANGGAAAAAATAAANAAASSGARAAAINAAAATAAKAAGSAEFSAGKTEASNIGNVGGVMKQGSVAASTAKAVSSSKDEITAEGDQGGYPDLADSDSDKRTTSNEENFDDDVSKKIEGKNARADKKEDLGSGEGSGLDASTASTADVEEGSKIKFNTTNNDDFRMAEEADNKQEDGLDGKATMEFNQTNDSSPAEEETDKTIDSALDANSGPREDAQVNADDKTTNLEVGNLKDTKVNDAAGSSASLGVEEGYKSFVTNTDAESRSANVSEAMNGGEAAPSSESEADGDENDENVGNEEKSSKETNAESRSAEKNSKHRSNDALSTEAGAQIASDEVLRGNNAPVKVNGVTKRIKAGKKIAGGMKKHDKKKEAKKAMAKMKVRRPAEKLTNTSEFFISSHGSVKSDSRQAKDRSNEFVVPRNQSKKIEDVKIKKKNVSEFFLIKTNNLTSNEPVGEEEVFSRNKEKVTFFTTPQKNSGNELDDFKLSESAKQHLLPGDLEKLSKLHRMLSMAQIDLLKKEKPEEVNAITRMLRPGFGRQKHVTEKHLKKGDLVKGKYRSVIHEALEQIEGVRKSLTRQEEQQLTGAQPKNEQYRKAIREALMEVDAVKKSLMQTATSSKILTNALAISNLANLLSESTNIFNKAYGVMHGGMPGSQVAGSMVTGGLLNPSASGLLINPAGPTGSGPKPKRPTNDIYAEIGTPATNEDEPGQKKSLQALPVGNHSKTKNKGFRTIKEMKRGFIGKA